MKCAECSTDLSRELCACCKTTLHDGKVIVCIGDAHLCPGCYNDAKLTEVVE